MPNHRHDQRGDVQSRDGQSCAPLLTNNEIPWCVPANKVLPDRKTGGEFQSGQMGQTVNLVALPS